MDFLIDPIRATTEFLQNWLTGLGLAAPLVQVILFVLGAFILTIGPMMLTVFLIWGERKIIGRVQDRIGPNRVGPWGIFQTFADMVKIFTKEHITPDGVDRFPYNLAPVLSVAAVLMVWAAIPFAITVYGVDLNVGVLYLIAVGSLGEMAVLMAGWGSNNKFALLAAFRAVAQLISYEVPMALSLLIPVMLAGSMSLQQIVLAQDIPYILLAPIPAIIFFISSIAEVGRAPFDLMESESELVAGFMIEYSGLKFGMYYVADFLHAFTVSLLFAVFFLGGWRGPLAEQYPMLGFGYLLGKSLIAYFMIILVRASVPRIRIDQMMDLNWKVLTPVTLAVIMVTALVAKVVPAGQTLLLVTTLLSANILVYAGTILIASRLRRGRHARPVVISKPRPVAVYPKPVTNARDGEQS